MPTPLFPQALATALSVHRYQVDKAGASYIWHVIRVAQQFEDDTRQIIGVLHDVLEDCDPEDRDEWKASIYGNFGTTVGDAVVALTHRKNEPRDDYYARVLANPIAHEVKVADVCDNYMRLWKLADGPTRTRLTKKYEHALHVLGRDR